MVVAQGAVGNLLKKDMKQAYILVHCVECHLFQVHIEKMKTTAKFTCTVCHCTQTIQRIFARSSKASDCRKLCQEYNAAGEDAVISTANYNDSTITHQATTTHNIDEFDGWHGFLSDDDEEEEEREGMPGERSNHQNPCTAHPCPDWVTSRAAGTRKRDAVSYRPREANQRRALSPRNTERPPVEEQQRWEDKGHPVLVGGSNTSGQSDAVQNEDEHGDAWFAEFV